MNRIIILLSIVALVFFGCSTEFDSEKWKTNEGVRYYMLDDLTKSGMLLGKSKKEVIELLDTTSIKHFDYDSNSWMYVIDIPGKVLATNTPVMLLDVEFENGEVVNAEVRH